MNPSLSVIIGGVALVLGVALYFLSDRKKQRGYTPVLIIVWLLIALFPISMIFYFFPGSESSGDLMGFKFGGAFAAYVFIWWFGISRSIKTGALDDLTKENGTLKNTIETLQNRQAAAQTGGPAPVVLINTQRYVCSLASDRSKKIGLITGAIRNIKNVDVWVNSENTNMQMARFYEASVSGIIRYLGAEKDGVGNVTNDTIAELLKGELGSNLYVRPANVLVTDPGKLASTNRVKKIFHVASVQGVEGRGYAPVPNVEDCVRNALCKLDETNGDLTSIVFPLLGTGAGKGELESSAKKLFDTAIDYYESTPESKIKEIYFIAYTDIQLRLCWDLLKNNAKLVAERESVSV